MSKQVQDAYIVAATRTPIGRSGRGYFKNTRPDDVAEFGERPCAKGMWGIIPGAMLIQLALACADKLIKYGA